MTTEKIGRQNTFAHYGPSVPTIILLADVLQITVIVFTFMNVECYLVLALRVSVRDVWRESRALYYRLSQPRDEKVKNKQTSLVWPNRLFQQIFQIEKRWRDKKQ